ncbi:hypothetical protein TNCV_1159721 [Trichonephila clavipes]|nr:hypothetical protein TNCV_1159721 [Trichonephila clavipes]
MEIVRASRIFLRSEKNRRLHYTQYYGDGDSKAFMSVKDTYGLNSVTKFECIGHVQKRVDQLTTRISLQNKLGLALYEYKTPLLFGQGKIVSCLKAGGKSNLITEVFDIARQMDSEVDSDDVQELMDSHNQELTMDELIEMQEQIKTMKNFSL